jgi:hypothetical protein
MERSEVVVQIEGGLGVGLAPRLLTSVCSRRAWLSRWLQARLRRCTRRASLDARG